MSTFKIFQNSFSAEKKKGNRAQHWHGRCFCQNLINKSLLSLDVKTFLTSSYDSPGVHAFSSSSRHGHPCLSQALVKAGNLITKWLVNLSCESCIVISVLSFLEAVCIDAPRFLSHSSFCHQVPHANRHGRQRCTQTDFPHPPHLV